MNQRPLAACADAPANDRQGRIPVIQLGVSTHTRSRVGKGVGKNSHSFCKFVESQLLSSRCSMEALSTISSCSLADCSDPDAAAIGARDEALTLVNAKVA